MDGLICGRIDTSTGAFTGALLDLPKTWLDHYTAENYAAVDPWAERAQSVRSALVYSHSRRSELFPERKPKVERLCNEMLESDMRGSVLLPGLINETSCIGMNVWSGENDRQFWTWANEQKDTLTLSACLASTFLSHRLEESTAVPNVFEFKNVRQKDNPLSPREQEALLWLAQGYRTDRISDRMNITNATVAFHIQSARKRLGATTREQAVAMAIARGLIAV